VLQLIEMDTTALMAEIRKIPPVTRFLAGSSLAVTLPVMLQLVSVYKVIYHYSLVFERLEAGKHNLSTWQIVEDTFVLSHRYGDYGPHFSSEVNFLQEPYAQGYINDCYSYTQALESTFYSTLSCYSMC
jgi:hypothetical protein